MGKRMRLSTRRKLETAIRLHREEQLDKALEMYDEVLESHPESSDALHFKGVLLHQTGDSKAAIELIRRSLSITPGHPDAINNLGNVLRESGRLEEAIDCYRKVLDLAPEHVDTLINMAAVQNDLQQPAHALEYLHKAMAINDRHPALWHNLGNSYRRNEQPERALSAYRRSLELVPNNGRARRAIAKYQFALGRPSEAIEELTELLDHSPDDAIARHMIAAYGGSEMPGRASNLFVTQTFDEFSASFDEVLARLDYKAPQLVADEISRLATGSGKKLDVLDIGCGTGLCGHLIRQWSGRLVGVDLSPGMLRKADLLEVYDELHEAELTTFMRGSEARYDVVICVDTFVYFGDLSTAIGAASEILNAAGYLVFTVESYDGDDGDFRLQHHGRYCHTASYVQRTLEASGFMVEALTPIVPRKESKEPVDGLLAVARLAA